MTVELIQVVGEYIVTPLVLLGIIYFVCNS